MLMLTLALRLEHQMALMLAMLMLFSCVACGASKVDPDKLVAVNDDAANRFLYQSMRSPWHEEMMK